MVFIKESYDFLMFKKVIKMCKNFTENIKHKLAMQELKPVINWLSAKRSIPLSHVYLLTSVGKKPFNIVL